MQTAKALGFCLIAFLGGCVSPAQQRMQACEQIREQLKQQRDSGQITWTRYAQQIEEGVPHCYPANFQPIAALAASYGTLVAEEVDAGRMTPAQANFAYQQFVNQLTQQVAAQANQQALVDAYRRAQRKQQTEQNFMRSMPKSIRCSPDYVGGFSCWY